jgi:hypothetical protein
MSDTLNSQEHAGAPWAAVATQLVAAGYLQLVEWVDLFPWNDLSKGNAQERLDVILLVAQLVVAACFYRRWLVAMCIGWVAYAGWLYLQVVSWWKPYLLVGRSVGPNWYFARTYKFLPQIGERPTPDADHIVLQLLLLAVLITGAVAIVRQVRGRAAATALAAPEASR